MTQETKEDIKKQIKEIQKSLGGLKLSKENNKLQVQKLQQKLDKLYSQVGK